MRETYGYGAGTTATCRGNVLYDGESLACSLCDWNWQLPDRIVMIQEEDNEKWRTGEYKDPRRRAGRPKRVEVAGSAASSGSDGSDGSAVQAVALHSDGHTEPWKPNHKWEAKEYEWESISL